MKPGRQSCESRLLSKEENSKLFSLLGVKCESLATTVVQLFLTESPDHDQWNRKDAGIMCVIKDHMKRSYYFRLYCLARKELIWENEVYSTFEYTAPRAWLHTFEAESSLVAFNFADEEEAKFFQKVVQDTLLNKRPRRIDRRSRTGQGNQGSVPHQSGVTGTHSYQKQSNHGSITNLPGRVGSTYTQNGPRKNRPEDNRSERNRTKKKFTKADIGLPQDFRHVSHVGWDENKGFNRHGEALVDPQLKEFFTKAGVSDNQLRDPETREFIYEFIESHGGLKSVNDDVNNSRVEPPEPVVAPPVPSRAPPLQPIGRPSPPAPPSLHDTQARPPPSVNQRTAPPPPPPPPPPVVHTAPKPPEVEVSRSIPPPPPPPPLPHLMAEVSTPSSVRPSGGNLDLRSALTEAIKSGTTLKHVDVEKQPSHLDSRGELLDQIRQGVELKSIQHIEKPSGPAVPLDGLAGALARALAERSRAFHNDSETETESEADGDSDSEWEE